MFKAWLTRWIFRYANFKWADYRDSKLSILSFTPGSKSPLEGEINPDFLVMMHRGDARGKTISECLKGAFLTDPG